MNTTTIEEIKAEEQINNLKLFLRIQTQTIDDVERLFKQGRMLEKDKEIAVASINKDTGKYIDWFYT